MRRIILLAATAALSASLLAPTGAGARPPSPMMTATACRVDADTVHVAVSWSALPTTGGEIFINTAPLFTGYERAWNQKGKSGSHAEDFDIGTDIADVVTVNLYNDKVTPITFEQREIGDNEGGNNVEEIQAC